MWGSRLGITEDENDFACRQGFAALRLADRICSARPGDPEQLEEENRVDVLLLGRRILDPRLNHGILDEFQALGYPVLSIDHPQGSALARAVFRSDLDRSSSSRRSTSRTCGQENFRRTACEGVGRQVRRRHPNVVVLDLSGFKCGHDAPTDGLIDNIISSSRTPYSALHDIDANKPGGSIKIRVKTYAHTLSLHEEKLQEMAAKRSELHQRVDEKRRELVRARQAALEQRAAAQPRARKELDEMSAAYTVYLSEDPVLPAFSEEHQRGRSMTPGKLTCTCPADDIEMS